MYRYHEVKDNANFDYGVVTYMDGENDPVTAEGYVAGDVMNENDESVVIIAEPDRTLHIPFRRLVKIRYPTEE